MDIKWGECRDVIFHEKTFKATDTISLLLYEGFLVYCVWVDSGGPAQHLLEVNFFMIMHFYIKPFKPC